MPAGSVIISTENMDETIKIGEEIFHVHIVDVFTGFVAYARDEYGVTVDFSAKMPTQQEAGEELRWSMLGIPKTHWPTEAGDFTLWLAQEENLKLLGDTIGIELELEAQEKDVGPFWADILCKNTLSNNWVLIENQLKRTDEH